MPRIAFYAGSFDPVTNGHLDVVRQSVFLCDRLIVAIGINPNRTKIIAFAMAGFMAAFSGVVAATRVGSIQPGGGLGMELQAIAACVIGGAALTGGRGSVVGTLTGAAIMMVIAGGCTHLGLKNPMQDIIIGAIIVAAVTLDQIRQRRLLAS